MYKCADNVRAGLNLKELLRGLPMRVPHLNLLLLSDIGSIQLGTAGTESVTESEQQGQRAGRQVQRLGRQGQRAGWQGQRAVWQGQGAGWQGQRVGWQGQRAGW